MIVFTDADKIAPALVKAIGELTDPHKGGKVNAGQRRYTYLQLPDLLTEVRTRFAANGLALMQSVEYVEGAVAVTTTVVHDSGQTATTAPLHIRTAGDAQSIGSATTYARRYALAALVGLSGSDDDDGERATQGQQHTQEYAQTRPVARQQATRGEVDPWAGSGPTGTPPAAEDPPRVHRPDDAASPKQIGAIKGIAATLGVGAISAGDLARWVLKQDQNPDRPDSLILTKGEASHVIEALQGDAGKTRAAAFLTHKENQA